MGSALPNDITDAKLEAKARKAAGSVMRGLSTYKSYPVVVFYITSAGNRVRIYAVKSKRGRAMADENKHEWLGTYTEVTCEQVVYEDMVSFLEQSLTD